MVTYTGDIGVVSGRYHSLEANKEKGTPEKTVLEIFGRSKTGESVCLLVSGLTPSFEITPLSAWTKIWKSATLFKTEFEQSKR